MQNFTNFKIEGRTLYPVFKICNIAEYLIKPEYQLQFIKTVVSLSEGFDLYNCYYTNDLDLSNEIDRFMQVAIYC